ncbi:MAG: BamA/TamA family outer membrane protein, partial [Muribaculaceae bacterium]|nr:BamA/TamA family outer membrane protein [Muribaculaceae bacterium]
MARRSPYLVRGERYCTDSLSAVRVRIANAVRNRGYYFFRPEYIEYLADSMIMTGRIALRLTVPTNIPAWSLRQYRVGEVVTRVYRNDGGGTPDTVETAHGTVIQMRPSRLRRNLIPGCVTFTEGKVFSVRDMNRTQTYLSRLGIFNAINIDVVPDTVNRNSNLLNVNIDCTFDRPLEAMVEVNASSKSNSYIGPGVSLGVTSRNIFGGGEQLQVKLTGTYEWQTGHDRRSLFNSYEVGITGSLSFPRLLAPKFIPRSRRNLNWTRFTLNADVLNRPHYFKMAQFNTSVSYDWQSSRYATNTFTPLKLTYTKLIHTTHDFDSIMNANQAVAQSFKSQFIPQMAYTYLYDRTINRDNTINWTFTAQEAGNVFWAIWRACGKDGEKKLFGMPFSQFVKASTQLVYGRRLGGDNWLVSRVAVGAAHAYGNSSQVPYSEQFWVGGANSVRAFTVRSIGPGSYHDYSSRSSDYFDQTGTFKFEANVEYRFPLYGPLHGAMFLDAGNVWLLENDPDRPGGKLKASTFLRDLALGTGVGLR